MSLFRPVSSRIASTRAFSTSSPTRASPLFALSALSNRNETQHFAQISRLNRVEHSPALGLIRESEVKPFKKSRTEEPEHVATATAIKATKDEELMQSKGSMLDYAQAKPAAPTLQASTPNTPVDAAMLQTLQQMSTQLANLEAKLLEMGIETEKDVRRTGALVTVLVAGAVAGLGVWKFWPPEAVRGGDTFAKKHVQERSRILPAEVVGHHPPTSAAGAVMGEPAVFPTATTQHPVALPAVPVVAVQKEVQGGSWWRSLLWKEH